MSAAHHCRLVKFIYPCLSAIGFGIASPGHAALEVYSDRSAWEAAAGSSGDKSEDFNSFASDLLYTGAGVQAGFLHLSVVDGVGDDSYRIDALPAQFATIPSVDSSTFATGISHQVIGSTRLSFDPVRALGFDYAAATYSTVDGILTTSRGDSVDLERFSAGPPRFVGLLYNGGETFESLTWFRVSPTPTDAFGTGIDNVVAMNPIPEPQISSLLLVGLGAIGYGVRRRMQA